MDSDPNQLNAPSDENFRKMPSLLQYALASHPGLKQKWRELTHDDLIDMWQKAQAMPEPDRSKAIQQITYLSKKFEAKAAEFIVNILLEEACA